MTRATTFRKVLSRLCEGALVLAWCGAAQADEPLFASRRITPPGEYTFGIEGPAVDASGALFVVNFGKPGTIGCR